MLTSVHNDAVKHVVSLKRRKEREQSKEFVIEGVRLVREGFLRRAGIIQVFYTAGKTGEFDQLLNEAQSQGIRCQEVSEQVFAKMSSTETPQGILAVVKQAEYGWEDLKWESPLFLIVDGIQDPGNLGSILRTALAAGVTEVCLTQGTVDLYNPKVLRSTMGTIFALRVLRDQTPEQIIRECRSRSYNLAIADMDGAQIYDLDVTKQLPIALVVGNEGSGPHELFKVQAQLKTAIPMDHDVESLNVGVATAVMLYEIRRQITRN